MLVVFSCDAHENITMFGDVAKRLLTMMGHSGTVPGAFLAKDVPQALSRLKISVSQMNDDEAEPQDPYADEDKEPDISLAHRALPLIELLEDAANSQCNVMWRER